jgi:hypothetical protein
VVAPAVVVSVETSSEIPLDAPAIVTVAGARGEALLLPNLDLRLGMVVPAELRTIIGPIVVRLRTSLRMFLVRRLPILVRRGIVLGLMAVVPIVGARNRGRRRRYPGEQQRNGKFTHDSDLSRT